jgi:hypothetical protein
MRTRRARGGYQMQPLYERVDVCTSMTKTMKKYVASSGAELSLFNSFGNRAV